MKQFYLCCLRILAISICCMPQAFAQFYMADPSFDPLLVKRDEGYVSSLIKLDDHKIMVVGGMDYVNSMERSLPIRLHADGSLDESFQISSYGVNFSVGMRSDGKLLHGSVGYGEDGEEYISFSLYGVDGQLVSSFLTELKFNIGWLNLAFDVQDDHKIIVASLTRQEDPSNPTSFKAVIKRLNEDGTADPTFEILELDASWINKVIIQADGKVLVNGTFEMADGTKKELIRLNSDGSLDTDFNTAISNIQAIAIQEDKKILVGTNHQVVRLHPNGEFDETFSSDWYSVRSMALQDDGKILIGCYIKDEIHHFYGYGQVLRLHQDGKRDETFIAGKGAPDKRINTLLVQQDGQILAGGGFTEYNGHPANGIVRLNSTNGQVDPSFSLKLETIGYIKDAVWQEDRKLLVFGDFNSVNEHPANDLTRLNIDGSIDQSFDIGTGVDGYWDVNGGHISDVKMQDDHKILVCGYFSSFNGVAVNSLLRLNTDGGMDAGFKNFIFENYYVEALAVQDDSKILVGGRSASGKEAVIFNRLLPDGNFDPDFVAGEGAANWVRQIQIQDDGKILIAGTIQQYNGKAVNNILRLNSNGSIDESFQVSGSNSPVKKIMLQKDGDILVMGDFTSFNGVLVNNLIRLKADGSLDESFKPDFGSFYQLQDFILQEDGQILVSGSLFGGSRKMVLLKSDGSLQEGFVLHEYSLGAYLGMLKAENKLIVHAGKVLMQLHYLKQQTITATPVLDTQIDSAPIVLEATSSSGLPVTWTLVSGPAFIDGNVLTLTGEPGVVTILASQPGNDVYDNAVPVELSFKVGNTLGVEGKESESIKVYPNPASGYIMVEFAGPAERISIQLFDLQGRRKETSFEQVGAAYRIDTAKLPKGLYLLKIAEGSHIYSNKLVLE